MRKLLFVVLSLFVISAISAQNKEEVKYYRTGKWNSVKQTWEYNKMMPGNGLIISMNSGVVSLDDNNGSIYRVFQTVETDKTGVANDGSHYKSSVFRALDKNGIKCLISLISYKDDPEFKVSIMYDNDVINYYIKL